MAERKIRLDDEVAARLESKIADLNVRELGDGTVLEIDINGMPRTMFDRCWMPDIASVSRMLEMASLAWIVRQGRGERGFRAPVVASETLEVMPYLYDVTFATPLVIRIGPASFWNKGFTIRIELVQRNTRHVLVTMTAMLIILDDVTGRATTLSPGQREILNNLGAQELPMKRRVLPKPPADAHAFNMKVAISDHDHLSHVNRTCYTRFCQDAAYDASVKGKLPSFSSGLDPATQQIQRVFVNYKAQSFCGDIFVISVWETEPRIICFHIVNQNDDSVVCSCSITYGPLPSAKL